MTKHNPKNERIKRQYFAYLREAKRQSEASVDAVAAALARFILVTGISSPLIIGRQSRSNITLLPRTTKRQEKS